MPQSENALPEAPMETSAELWEMAKRAKRLAWLLHPDDEGRLRLMGFAGELEARAKLVDAGGTKPLDA